MSQETFKIVQEMDAKALETQFILQCAPFISGLKASNLLNINLSQLDRLRQMLKQSRISYCILLVHQGRMTLLLYNRARLESYLEQYESRKLLGELGYFRFSMEEILSEFKKRYRGYMTEHQGFLHEMGLLLGYPTEDVEGFIKNEGKNFLLTGYWKVYEKPEMKYRLFQKFEMAKESMIQLVSNGVSIVDIIDIYEEGLQKAAC